MRLSDLQWRALANARRHGFCDGPVDVPTQLMLIVSELSEALEHYRENNNGFRLEELWYRSSKPDGFAAEMADVVIRACQFSASLGIDLEAVVVEKMKYNESRPHKHGGKVC